MEYRMSEHFDAINKPAPEKTYFWSRAPGRILNKFTGQEVIPSYVKKTELTMVSETVVSSAPKTVVRVYQEKEVNVPQGPYFSGTVREWYETLLEVIADASNTLFKRHLQVPDVLEVSPDVLTMLEHTVGYKPDWSVLEGKKAPTVPMANGEIVGILNNRWKIMKCMNMAPDEAKVVLITEFRSKVVQHPERPTEVFPEGHELAGITKPQLPEINIEPLGSLQRLDEWTVKIMDMCLI